MKLSNYEIVMKSICKNLVDVEERLSRDRIENEVNGVKILMDNSPLHILQSSFFRNLTNKLEAKDWELMKRDLETKFNVEMDAGTLIQGDEQQNRNTTWWIDKGRFESENFYWNRYREYMRETLPFDVVKAIDEDTNAVMNNLADPELDEFSRYGMVVGHVQSGKTSNYAGLICKAADAGYKFIVVIAGSTNTLRNQTQDRINKSFIGKDETGTYIGAGKYGDKKPSYDPHILTTKNKDFNIKDAINNSQGLNFDNVTSPIVLIIKKHSSTLSNVISWLSNVYKDGKISTHSMLLIDDESDYASINTKKPENPTAINDKIRKLLNKFKKSAYVAYTATPYANIFIDHKATDDIRGKDLFPKDFIYALEVPSNYFGARKIFIDSDYEHIITIEEPENLRLKHKKDDDISYLPKTLEEAIRLFLINIGIRNLRNQGSKHNSMLIHASRFTMIHQKIGICVGSYFSGLRNDIVSYGLLNNAEIQSNNIRDMKETFKLRCKDCEFTWEDVIKSISYKVESVIIREVHSETDKKNNLIYDDDRPTNAIVIGGTSLARGYTLEGLSISYFLRSTVFYDTLMQMGRWFGYRGGYDDLCKIYMTEDMRDNFKFIIEATEDLFEDFKDMELDKKTPEDFGLAVRQHPDSILQVTARNKQQSSIDIDHEIKLDGSLKETSKLSPDNISIKNNIKLIENTISKVDSISKSKYINGSYLWENIDRNIVKDFINNFNVYRPNPKKNDLMGIKSRMPIKFINTYINDININWDIALYSGEGKEKDLPNGITIKKQIRKIDIKDNGNYYEIRKRQVSSGNSESLPLSDEECKGIKRDSRKAVRERLKRPLLMLHILDTTIEGYGDNMELAAFGVSFPGRITSKGKTIKVKVNTVYIENLLKEEVYDD